MSEKKVPRDSDDTDDIGRDLERLDKLLRRGLDDIADIEIDEITSGLSAEEIDLQGGATAIERSAYSQAKKIENLVFDEQIQFIVENDLHDIADIPVETIEQLQTVPPETKIAKCTPEEAKTGEADKLLELYDKEYQERAGIIVRSDGSHFTFFAARHGKTVLFRGRIFLLSPDRDASCKVHVTGDRMEASVDCHPAIGSGTPLSFTLVLGALEKAGVVRGYDKAAIEKAVNNVNDNRLSVVNVIAARGRPVQNGLDSQITLHFPTEAPDIGFTILPDGRIDYKKQAPIKMVTTGDLLATVSEPQPGTDGYTVTGEVLPAKPGEVDDILEGENVRRDEMGDKLFAECNGIISFHEKVLSVFPHYHVDGDVDMHSGNINFNGSVTVLGSVKSGFEVKAAGDIFISGSSEAATIEAGRDIRINGAAVGGNNTLIHAGRNIFAGHVQNAHLEAQGDIIVVRSVMHSRIYSTGKLFLHDRNGSIVGGTVNAMRGVEAMSIGSHIGTQTEVIAGSDFLVKRKKNKLQEIIRFHEANLAKIDTVLRPLMTIVKKGIPLGSDKKRRLGSIVEKRFNIIKQLRVIRRHFSVLSEIDPASIKAAITVNQTLFQDVIIKIGTLTLHTNEDLRGVVCRMSTDQKKIELHSRSEVPEDGKGKP